MSLTVHRPNAEMKSLNYPGALPSGNPASKSLGADSGAELAQWLEANRYIYDSIMNGSADLPPAEQTQFMEWWNWTYQQLGSGGGAMGWDPLAGATEDGAPGQTGAAGNTVFDGASTQLQYTGEAGTYDVYSFDTIIDVPSTAVDVSVEKTTDTRLQPPEADVFKITFTNKATGVETVVFVHNSADVNSIKINTPNGLKVQDKTGDGRIDVGEYVEGSAAGGGGIPENADIEGDTATYDGVAGTMLDFMPPFGGIANHIVNADMNLQVNNSDRVVVERQADGGYKVTVTDKDGKATRFTVPVGFKLNLMAHAPNVTFKEGGKAVDGINPAVAGGPDELAGPGEGVPQRTTPGADVDGAEGIPEGWENFSLNGTEGSAAPEPSEEMPPELVDLFDTMGIDPNDPKLDLERWIAEVNSGVTPPSDDLLNALMTNDPQLKARWENYLENPSDDHAMKQVRDRLVILLSTLFAGEVGKTGDFPEGMEPDALLESRTVFFGDTPFEITDEFTFERVGEGTDGTDSTAPLGDDPYGQARAEEFQPYLETLSEVLGITYDELLAKIGEMSTEEKGSLWHILDYTTERNFMPWDLDRLFPVLASLDPTLEQALNAFQGSGTDHDSYTFIRDRVVTLLQVLYPNAGISAGSGIDSISFFGQDYDIIDEDTDHSSDPTGWLLWKE